MSKNLKPFKTLSEQTDRIINRKCLADKLQLEEKLSVVNYYRLAGYLYTFRRKSNNIRAEEYEAGTKFEEVWDLYRFDRRLRLSILDAIERIEIALRTKMAYYWAEYAMKEDVSNPQSEDRFYFKKGFKESFLREVQKRYENSKDDCAIHHRDVLGIMEAKDLPIWVFVEFTMFANLIFLYREGLANSIKKKVAKDFGFDDKDKFVAALSLLREARNICAHHGRVWNRLWTHDSKNKKPFRSHQPLAPELELNYPFSIKQTTTAYLLFVVLEYFLRRIAPQSCWMKRLLVLFDELPLPDKLYLEMGINSEMLTILRDMR